MLSGVAAVVFQDTVCLTRNCACLETLPQANGVLVVVSPMVVTSAE